MTLELQPLPSEPSRTPPATAPESQSPEPRLAESRMPEASGDALAAAVRGTVLRPADPSFAAAAGVWNLAAAVSPALIVRVADVARTYRRLATVKAAWDPDNVFHLNQNIRPAPRACADEVRVRGRAVRRGAAGEPPLAVVRRDAAHHIVIRRLPLLIHGRWRRAPSARRCLPRATRQQPTRTPAMTNGYAPLMYLLLLERERELARDSEIDRLIRDSREATERQRPAAAERSISAPRFGLGRLTRRPLTGGA